MDLHVQVDVTHGTRVVLQALSDPDFVREITMRAGAQLADLTVNESDEGDVTIVVRRTLPTSQIPAQARAFVGATLEVRQVEAWSRPMEGDDGPRYGTAVVEISGAPVQAKGNTRLIPLAGGCELHYDLTVTSSVPLLGPMIERTVAQSVRSAIDSHSELLQEWLDRNN